MEKNHIEQVNLKQREHLVTMLEDAKRRERGRLHDSETASESQILWQLAKEKGCGDLVKQIDEHDAQISALQLLIRDADKKLVKMGFERRDSSLSLHWDAPTNLRKLLAERLDHAQQPIEKSLRKYDLAIARLWISPSSEDLQKVVEGVI